MTKHSSSLERLIQTLLWSSTDFDGNSLDKKYGISDVHESSLRKLESEFQDFMDKVTLLIGQKLGDFDNIEDFYLLSTTASQVEHDYILTRNRHGCGFWDGDWDASVSQILTDTAHLHPEIEPYVGDDNLIHFCL